MDKVKFSRAFNMLGGGEDELYCSRVYVQARISPYYWRDMEITLNFIFWLLKGQDQHVKRSYIWEQRERRNR